MVRKIKIGGFYKPTHCVQILIGVTSNTLSTVVSLFDMGADSNQKGNSYPQLARSTLNSQSVAIANSHTQSIEYKWRLAPAHLHWRFNACPLGLWLLKAPPLAYCSNSHFSTDAYVDYSNLSKNSSLGTRFCGDHHNKNRDRFDTLYSEVLNGNTNSHNDAQGEKNNWYRVACQETYNCIYASDSIVQLPRSCAQEDWDPLQRPWTTMFQESMRTEEYSTWKPVNVYISYLTAKLICLPEFMKVPFASNGPNCIVYAKVHKLDMLKDVDPVQTKCDKLNSNSKVEIAPFRLLESCK